MNSHDRFADVVYLRTTEGVDGESRGTTWVGHAFLYPFDGGNEVLGIDLEGVAAQFAQRAECSSPCRPGSAIDSMGSKAWWPAS